MEQNKQIVIKKIADGFWVKNKNQILSCKARGDLKKVGIFVGDYVLINTINDECIIEKVEPRINQLIRPPLCNLEQLIITISCIPKPDFMMVDKLLLFAYSYGIEPILVINKIDISNDICDYVKNVYSKFIDVFFVSAKTKENLPKLVEKLRNKISAFAGQSAVGKSALINSILDKEISREGELSKKIGRGKNTTRHSEIFIHDDILIADTAGFTSLDERLLPIPYYELNLYYPDFLEYKETCKFHSCNHYKEQTQFCSVKKAVDRNLLDKDRYMRYTRIYEILKEKWVRTHG